MNAENKSNKKMFTKDIYEDIKNSIIKLDYKPGYRLDELTLQEKYGVSRTPIRECLKRLEYEKLVTIIPRKGTFVTQIDLKELKDMFEVKITLEEYAGELAIKRADESDICKMRKLIDSSSDIMAKNDYDEIINLDQEFHKMVRKFSRNSELEHLLDIYNLKATRLWYYVLDDVPEFDSFVMDFKNFFSCICDQDIARGRIISGDHVQRFIAYIKDKMF